jgi:hypothetical protein
MRGKGLASLCIGVFGSVATVSTFADEDSDTVEPLRCISMGSVRTTRIVDDTNILFYRRGGDIYLNTLDRRCVGLSRNGKFTYQVESGARYVRVCSSDTITVLESAGHGFSCGLGDFVPIAEEVALQLLDPSSARAPAAIVGEPVELPREEEQAPQSDE